MLDGEQMDTARVATWLLSRAAETAGWIDVKPLALAVAAGLDERVARAAVGRLVARGYVALEKRGGGFWLQPTGAGRGPLAAYVLGFAEARLTDVEKHLDQQAEERGKGRGGSAAGGNARDSTAGQ